MSFSVRNTTEINQTINSSVIKSANIISDTLLVSGVSFASVYATIPSGIKLYTIKLFTPNPNTWWVDDAVGSPLVLSDGTVFRFGFNASIVSITVNTINMLPEKINGNNVLVSIGNSAGITDTPETFVSRATVERLNQQGVILANVTANNNLGTDGSSLNTIPASENDYVLVSLGTQSPSPLVSGTITATLSYYER